MVLCPRAQKNQNPCKANYWRKAMSNGWTPERRLQQAAAIRRWQPWSQSTGPRTASGKAKVARNADKSGQWREERELMKQLRQALREQREFVREVE